jgi:hypothetical protein
MSWMPVIGWNQITCDWLEPNYLWLAETLEACTAMLGLCTKLGCRLSCRNSKYRECLGLMPFCFFHLTGTTAEFMKYLHVNLIIPYITMRKMVQKIVYPFHKWAEWCPGKTVCLTLDSQLVVGLFYLNLSAFLTSNPMTVQQWKSWLNEKAK